MATKKRKIALSMAVLAVMAVVIGGGTFASFNASTTNAGNRFSTGTLVLNNAVGATSCLSTNGGSTDSNANSTGCAKVIDVGVRKPGDSTTVPVVLGNSGSISGDLSFSIGSCTTSNAAAENFHGTGDLCNALQISVDGTSRSFGLGNTLLTSPSLASGATRTVDVTVTFPNGTPANDNPLQGRTATFDITWQLAQN